MGTRKFQGRPVTKEIVTLGIGGSIERPPGLEKPVRVKFSAWADLNKLTHKFEKNGSVTEGSVLTIDASTFEILEMEDLPEQHELPNVGGPAELSAVGDPDD